MRASYVLLRERTSVFDRPTHAPDRRQRTFLGVVQIGFVECRNDVLNFRRVLRAENPGGSAFCPCARLESTAPAATMTGLNGPYVLSTGYRWGCQSASERFCAPRAPRAKRERKSSPTRRCRGRTRASVPRANDARNVQRQPMRNERARRADLDRGVKSRSNRRRACVELGLHLGSSALACARERSWLDKRTSLSKF
jgi:hypothetical protein